MALIDDVTNYYSFDTNANDSTGNLNGTESGSIVHGATGKISSTYTWDGTDDYIAISGAGGFFNSSRATGSVSFWFKPSDDINSGARVSDYIIGVVGGGDRYFRLGFSSNLGIASEYIHVLFRNGEGSGPAQYLKSTTASWSSSTWYHVVATWDSSGEELFINGISQDTSTYNSGYTSGDSLGAHIGDIYNGTVLYSGLIDEVAFFSTKLSSDDVTKLYNSGSGLTYPFIRSLILGPVHKNYAGTDASPTNINVINIIIPSANLTGSLTSVEVKSSSGGSYETVSGDPTAVGGATHTFTTPGPEVYIRINASSATLSGKVNDAIKTAVYCKVVS